jgi:Na+/proline symporter
MFNIYFFTVIAYIVAIIAISFWRSRGVKGQEEFMVAGRSVPAWLLAGTLICTWIGAGSLLGGGGRVYRDGLSQIWLSAGAWLGIIVIFFLAARVRRIAKYTVQDILEQRYHPLARIFGAIVVILGSTTIFSYQLRGGAFVLEYMMGLPQVWGIILTAAVVIAFTALAGLRSIVAVDVLNGILIILAIIVGLPLMLVIVGGGDIDAGLEHAVETPPASHYQVFGSQDQIASSEAVAARGGWTPQSREAIEASNAEHGAPQSNWLLGLVWALGVFFPTFFLLLGESSIYQKFYSAKDDANVKRAVIYFLVGVVIIEIALAVFALFSSTHPKANAWRVSYDKFCSAELGLIAREKQLTATEKAGGLTADEAAMVSGTHKQIVEQRTANWSEFIAVIQHGGTVEMPSPDPNKPNLYIQEATALYQTRTDSINLFSAFELLPQWAGVLLLMGGMAIILSTGNSFLMAASTAFVRDIWQRFLRPRAGQTEIIVIHRLTMVALAVFAVAQLTLLRETVWQMALAAYTLIGAGLTPVILAAFLWKRVTAAGGVASVAAGLLTWTLFVTLKIAHVIDIDYDFIIYPAAGASILALIVVSLLTKPSPPEVYQAFMKVKTAEVAKQE